MRIETQKGKHIICGYILPSRYILPGQQWMGSSGAIVDVWAVTPPQEGEYNGQVYYSWPTKEGREYHDKDSFSFQCRYCLIIGDEVNVDA